MRVLTFTIRNSKEMIREPLNLALGIGFPLVVLVLLSVIQANIPVDLFVIERLIPGIAVFGLSFIATFSGTLIAAVRDTSFLLRLFTTPLTAYDYIMGYTLPLLPMAILQIIISFIAAFFLGLTLNLNVLLSILILIPAAVVFIGFGLLAGSLFNEKMVGNVCGAVLTNLTVWLSGAWFDLDLVGGWFEKLAYSLPFAHAVDASRAAIVGDYSAIMPHLWWVIGYAVVTMLIAIVVFKKKMTSDQ